MQFAEHFSLRELTSTNTGLDNTPTSRQKDVLCSLSHILENIRAVVGKPLYINSAFRTPEVNRAVGGSRTSHHLYGKAVDISLRNLNKDERETLFRAIQARHPCEVILYDTFIHVAFDISRLGTHGPIKTWQEEMPDTFGTSWNDKGTDSDDL